MPQIEVTFDIDANGIVHVSAKDRGTGKEQSITITGQSALDKDKIDQMVKDAEAHAAEDKKRREEAEVRNSADTLVYQTEKLLRENGDKLTDDERSDVEAKLSATKEARRRRRHRAHQGHHRGADGRQPGLRANASTNRRPPRATAARSTAAGDDDIVDAEIIDEDDRA